MRLIQRGNRLFTVRLPRRTVRWFLIIASARVLLAGVAQTESRAEIIINADVRTIDFEGYAFVRAGEAAGVESPFDLPAPPGFTSYHPATQTRNASKSGPLGTATGRVTANTNTTISLIGDVLTLTSSASFDTEAGFTLASNPQGDFINGGASGTGSFSLDFPFTITERQYEYSFTGEVVHNVSGVNGRSEADLKFEDVLNLHDDHRSGSGTVPVSGSGELDLGPSGSNSFFFIAHLTVDAGAGAGRPGHTDSDGSFNFQLTVSPLGVRWVNPTGGLFADTQNWNPQQVPGTGDTALFDLFASYSVDLNGPQTVERLVVRDGTVEFNGGNLTVAASSPTVPSVSIKQDGRLNLRPTGGLRSVDAIIGNAVPLDPANPPTAAVRVSNRTEGWKNS